MKAIVQEIYGGPEVLHFADVPMPVLRPRDLLVRVQAVSVNPVDTKVRGGGPAGSPVAQSPMIVGWDAAGSSSRSARRSTCFRPGDAVFFAGDITRRAATPSTWPSTSASSGTSRQSLSEAAAAACRSPR